MNTEIKTEPRLVAKFIGLARLAAREGQSIGSTSERIVAAFLNDRTDWLPEDYPNPLEAMERLKRGGEDWYETMLVVHKLDWREKGAYVAETL